MRALHLLLSLYIVDVSKQIFLDCPTEAQMLPCIPGSNTCPNTSWTCIPLRGNTADTTCCDNAYIIQLWDSTSTTSTTASTTASATASATASTTASAISPTTTTPCVDRVNPATGVSDCPSRLQLCTDPLYYTLMTEQCPKTCNRCPDPSNPQPPPPPAPTCRDFVHYQTGISDCPRLSYLCTNSLYSSLMRQQCPKTCGYC